MLLIRRIILSLLTSRVVRWVDRGSKVTSRTPVWVALGLSVGILKRIGKILETL